MKRTFFLPLALLALLGAAPLAHAQDAPVRRAGAEQRAERMQSRLDYQVERMALTLDLTADQKARLRDVLAARQQHWQAQQRQRAATTPAERQAQAQARRDQMQARRDSTQQAIRAILTPEQAQKFDALQQLNQSHRGEMRENRGSRMEQRGERMKRRGQRMQNRPPGGGQN